MRELGLLHGSPSEILPQNVLSRASVAVDKVVGKSARKEFPMRSGIAFKSCLVATAVLLWMASASAQQIRFFPDFTGYANLQMNGAHQATWNCGNFCMDRPQNVLRLTPGNLSTNSHQESATSWFKMPQQVNLGFTTYFAFQIHNAGGCCNPGDGLAFVVQNSSSTDLSYGAIGHGVTAWGVSGGGMGYAGIPNSLAVEFDTFTNAWDPSSNHVAVQGCGTATNGPVHIPGTFTIGKNHDVTSCLVAAGLNSNPCGSSSPSCVPHLGVTCANNTCADGSVHQVVIEYTPPASNGSGTLMVWIDQPFIPRTHTPCPNNRITGCPVAAVTSINIPYNLDNTNSSTGILLAGGTSAWVGFTGSQTNVTQAEDVLAWEFTPHAPASIQQVIPPGGTEARYTFGANDAGVTYFQGFVNHNGCDFMQPDGVVCFMTVLATPTPRNVFYQRLVGTPFSNEQCVVYLGTGGNCVVYSITCQNSNGVFAPSCPQSKPGTCTDGSKDPGCIVFSTSFYTADGLTGTNADYLKADPIGSNNWNTIFVSYDPNAFDGKTTGTGNTPSDFAATIKVFRQAP